MLTLFKNSTNQKTMFNDYELWITWGVFIFYQMCFNIIYKQLTKANAHVCGSLHHACVVVLFSCITLQKFASAKVNIDTCDIATLKESMTIVIYTGSYTICELITLSKKEPRSTYFYHLAILAGVTIVHFNYGYIMLFILLELQEVSTIFLHLCKIYPKFIQMFK